MKKSKLFLIAFLCLALLAYLFYLIYRKYILFSEFKANTIDLHLVGAQVYNFYESNLHLPSTKEELSGLLQKTKDKYLQEQFRKMEYNFFYDSPNESLSLYSFGLDEDDDQLEKYYKLDKKFLNLLFIDGDIILAKWTMSDMLPYLVDKSIILDITGSKGSFDLLLSMKNLIICGYNKGDFLLNNQSWIVIHNTNDKICVKIYNQNMESSPSLEKVMELAILSSKVLAGNNGIRIGLYIDTEYLPPSIDCI